jgi:serine/threonine-protein kinase
MSYCLNPNCSDPKSAGHFRTCEVCGTTLLLRDRYRVIQSLGQGGFGATFLAQDEGLPGGPSCVIKQLRPSGSAPHVIQMARDLFEREAKTLGKIGTHPQIPRLLDYFEESEHFYLVQEFISGATLQQEVRKNGLYSEPGAKQFLTEILPLLQYIHERKVIHRDIKPANLIRRSQDARLVLIDFGAVKNQVSQAAANPSGQTALTAYAIGTPGFAPPEQMAMRPVYASDIYAVGVTCIYLLTGKTPKDLNYNPTTGEMMWGDLVQVSDHFRNVLSKMLEVSVRSRYQTSQEVLNALDMEPYLDSLSNSLLIKPGNNTTQQSMRQESHEAPRFSRSSHPPSNPGANPNLNVAQIAAAIRARRNKPGETSGITTKRTNSDNSISKSNVLTNVKSNNQPERKFDAQGLLQAYLKGRRDFSLRNLRLLNLAGADLSGANFHASQLDKINLQGAKLYDSDFGKACLVQANLKDANLSKAYLSHADLEGADLRGANLTCAQLSQANLKGANLCGANLAGAKVSEEQLALAKTNWLTVRPNGKRGLM